MKVFALSFLLVFSIKMTKADAAPEFAAILTEEDREQVLQLINIACSDRWCESRYDFKFKSFYCDENSSSCRLRFKIMDRGFIPGKYSEKYSSCIFKEIKSAEQIIFDGKLTAGFLHDLDECITLTLEK